jgi:hypothetical protein
MLRHESGRRTAVRPHVVELLDTFQAAERAGATAVGRWLAACGDPRLRGGLRVICVRDRRHAALVEERLRALGGVPSARPSRALAALCEVVGDPGVSDRSKLAMLLARFPVTAPPPLAPVLEHVGGDAETRSLFEAIGDDERSSVGWLRRMHDVLAAEDR